MRDGTVYIIGGTSEANRTAGLLEGEGFRVVLSVASPLGRRYAAAETDVGARDAAGIAARAASAGARAIIDCSHPFARAVSREAEEAAAINRVPYLRFTRPPDSLEAPHLVRVEGWDEAVARLREWKQRALLTIGVRQLHIFTGAGIDLVARVLPEPGSLARCRELGLDDERIIAAEPPHSVGFNRRCIRRAAAGVMVSKDSGREGGLPQKAEAAAAEGVRLLVIERPPEPGAYTDPERLLAALRRAG